MNNKNLRISFLTVNGPSTWPSVGLVSAELKSSIKTLYPKIKEYRILESTPPPVKDDIWIVPVGMVHSHLMKWLRDNFKTAYQRPRIIFFLGGEGAKLCYNLFFHKDIFRVDDEWIVSSHVEKNLLDHYFPANNRTHVLFYPVSKKFVPLKSSAEKMALRKKLNLPLTKSKSLLLYAGRISVQKNIFALLDLLEKNPELYLIICGDVDTLGLPHFDSDTKINLPILIVEEISKRKLGDRIEFKNFLSQDELKKIMQSCDYQISLSAHYGEDFGYSIAQGLACGLRSVLTYWGGHINWKDFFKDSELTYIPLDWTKNPKMGKPLLNDLLKLPIKSKIDFAKSYQKHFKESFERIIANTTFNDRKINLVINDELINYWATIRITPRASMYLSSEDSHFQNVVKFYSGK
jgi:glycosyltransferase involved in cell wall biosynthesis